jgi:hypothetical protein
MYGGVGRVHFFPHAHLPQAALNPLLGQLLCADLHAPKKI